jgi:hypothetical protein
MHVVVFHCILRGEPRDVESFFPERNLGEGELEVFRSLYTQRENGERSCEGNQLVRSKRLDSLRPLQS